MDSPVIATRVLSASIGRCPPGPGVTSGRSRRAYESCIFHKTTTLVVDTPYPTNIRHIPVSSQQMQSTSQEQPNNPKDCLACRVIGTGALAGVGIYALNQSRAHAPGSVVGKRIMAGVGICECTPPDFAGLRCSFGHAVTLGFLAGSYLRWNK